MQETSFDLERFANYIRREYGKPSENGFRNIMASREFESLMSVASESEKYGIAMRALNQALVKDGKPAPTPSFGKMADVRPRIFPFTGKRPALKP